VVPIRLRAAVVVLYVWRAEGVLTLMSGLDTAPLAAQATPAPPSRMLRRCPQMPGYAPIARASDQVNA
jgi:hypothetical protein